MGIGKWRFAKCNVEPRCNEVPRDWENVFVVSIGFVISGFSSLSTGAEFFSALRLLHLVY